MSQSQTIFAFTFSFQSLFRLLVPRSLTEILFFWLFPLLLIFTLRPLRLRPSNHELMSDTMALHFRSATQFE